MIVINKQIRSLSKKTESIKNTQVKFLELKDTISKLKN